MIPSEILCSVFNRLSAVKKDSAKLMRLKNMITKVTLCYKYGTKYLSKEQKLALHYNHSFTQSRVVPVQSVFIDHLWSLGIL